MASDIRAKVLAAADIPSELLYVPQWDVKIEVRGMSVAENRAFMEKVTKRNRAGDIEINRTRFAPELLIATVFDPETGDPVFDAADRDALGEKSSAAVSTVLNVATRLSGLNPPEERVEDFDETPTGDTS